MLDSEDTRVMIEALRQLGIAVEHDRGGGNDPRGRLRRTIARSEADLYVANSGTTVRFLTAMADAWARARFGSTARRACASGRSQDLLDALRQLGADAASELGDRLSAGGRSGGRVCRAAGPTVAGNISSQFLSGLLMAAPYAGSRWNWSVRGALVSQPYVDMTLA